MKSIYSVVNWWCMLRKLWKFTLSLSLSYFFGRNSVKATQLLITKRVGLTKKFSKQGYFSISTLCFHTEKHGNDKNSVKTTKKVKKSAVFQFHEIFSQLKKNVLLFSLACKIFREINSQCVILQFWFDGILNERTFLKNQLSSKVENVVD